MRQVTLSDLQKVLQPLNRSHSGCCCCLFKARRDYRRVDVQHEIPQGIQRLCGICSYQSGNLPLSDDLFQEFVTLLCEKWGLLKASNPDVYLQPSNIQDSPYFIAVAKVLAKDPRANLQETDKSYLYLLMPDVENTNDAFGQRLIDDPTKLHYTRQYLVSDTELLTTLRITGKLNHPFFPQEALSDELVTYLCVHYRKKVYAALKKTLRAGAEMPPGYLLGLHGILEPACRSTDAVENFEQGYDAYTKFVGGLDRLTEQQRAVFLTLTAGKGHTIAHYIAEIESPSSEGTCLSDCAINICDIITTLIDARKHEKRFFMKQERGSLYGIS
ncbi:MAG: hypothetical protein COB66_09355 [Coxiella sp. (in: Bacteria)]|nr:MAG: hypothetical protein COB66_09355 [Coxiella sp. (in: g-proteobacteria)]